MQEDTECGATTRSADSRSVGPGSPTKGVRRKQRWQEKKKKKKTKKKKKKRKHRQGGEDLLLGKAVGKRHVGRGATQGAVWGAEKGGRERGEMKWSGFRGRKGVKEEREKGGGTEIS